MYGSRKEETEAMHLTEVKPLRQLPVEQLPNGGSMLVGKAPLPESLRGVFWLSDQGASSCLASFGGPNGDGGDCSLGRLDKDNKALIRVMGDRVWALGCACDDDPIDLIYEFTFDDAREPTRADIKPHANWDGVKEDVADAGVQAEAPLLFMLAPLSHHWMELLDHDPEFPNSVVWHRKSGVGCIPLYDYKLVQILDENSHPVNPAFQHWVDYMKTGDGSESEGNIFYHSD